MTASSSSEAESLARGILRNKLAACVNLVPGIRSFYWWKGKVDSGREVLLLIKTERSRLQRLHRWVRANHSYEVPEFLALPLDRGDPTYLEWLRSSLPGAAIDKSL